MHRNSVRAEGVDDHHVIEITRSARRHFAELQRHVFFIFLVKVLIRQIHAQTSVAHEDLHLAAAMDGILERIEIRANVFAISCVAVVSVGKGNLLRAD